MPAKQLKCPVSGKMKYVSSCMKRECNNLVINITFQESWRPATGQKVVKGKMKTKFECMPE